MNDRQQVASVGHMIKINTALASPLPAYCRAFDQPAEIDKILLYMDSRNKKRIVKDFEKLDPELQEQVKLVNPDGFHRNLISYTDKGGNKVTALPFETDTTYYLLRMTLKEAKRKMEEDDDYNEEGELKEAARTEYEDKYGDLDYIDGQFRNDYEPDDY